jgi:hypothetical protein
VSAPTPAGQRSGCLFLLGCMALVALALVLIFKGLT